MNLASRLEKGVFEPDSLPPGAVLALGLLPPIAAGLVFFKLLAVYALAVALLVGALGTVVARGLKLQGGVTPAVAAVIAVSLLGAAAPMSWVAIAAALGAVLEVVRLRWFRRAGVQVGVVAAAAVFLASRGLTAAYLNPGRLRPLAEPIRLWASSGGGAPIDPVRLYVGNVPGPLFATSLLAVVIAAAWLWYARRLSLAVLVAFACGAAIPIVVWRWNPGYQLDSGPTWFLVALVLADRDSLPGSRAARPLLGFAAGIVGIGLRRQGLGIEAMILAVAGLQMAVAGVEGLEWLVSHRRRILGRVRALRRGAVRQLIGRRTAA